MKKPKTYIGKHYGRLTVIKYDGLGPTRKSMWYCQCSCDGGIKLYWQQGLRAGITKSCGCLQKQIASKVCRATKRRHGYKTRGKPKPEYAAWSAAKNRCNNPNNVSYFYYGGRGIIFCKRWQGKQGFTNFLKDMGDKPKPKIKYSLDRINPNGNYCPSNCQWATRGEQIKNRRPVRAVGQFSDKTLMTELTRRGYKITNPL